MQLKFYLYSYKTIYLALLILLLTVSSESQLAEKFTDYKKYEMIRTDSSISKVTEGINFAWGMTFIDDHSLLITEKNGRILKVNTINGSIVTIRISRIYLFLIHL